jgi:hypothetical protein
MTEKYAHFCADGHQPIGHNDSEHELCPLCRALNEIEALEDEIDQHDEICKGVNNL